MVNVLITGGAGFLGARLARDLLATGLVEVDGDTAAPLTRLTLADQAPVPEDLAADPRVQAIQGDLADLMDPAGQGRAALSGTDVIFHLAAAVSGACEADFDLGLRANVQVTQTLLQAARSLGTNPVVVFASSVAVFGGSPEHPLPEVVTDQTLPNPQTSYGIQKFACEQFVADHTRKGFVRGRSLRLMTVSVRPGKPNAAASGFFSGIVREPLAGLRAVCPVGPETGVVLASPAKTIEGLRAAAGASAERWGGRTAVSLPALCVTVGEMVAALEQVAGREVTARIDWVPDPDVAEMVHGWPGRLESERAARLGLTADPDFASLIRQYIAENPGQIQG